MACSTVTTRITSKDILIQFLPCGAAGTHVQHLYMHADVSGGSFKLRVNGEETAAIAYNATTATMIASINTALDNLNTLSAGDIVASGTVQTDITLTATGLGSAWVSILVSDDSLTGNATADPNYTTEVTTQGSALITLSSDVSSFSFEETVETVDVTAISEYEATEIDVKSSMTFSMNIYKANQSWEHVIFAGQSGILYVYPEGKFDGKQYFALNALIESVSEDYPDHEKVEKEISGMRQGAMVAPLRSLYYA